ncbi:MAG: MFS transporter [Acidobacteria bacterium]|nr:MFS transporter [Acidobacteriota bacterium]
MPGNKKRQILHRNVIVTGFTSFFTDVSSEMIYPILQGFITTIMKSQAALIGPILGIIEGISEAAASLLKTFSGYFSDKTQKRKMPTILGYTLSWAAKALFLLPYWYSVLGARLFDKVGKGIRTAPRDALISESTPKKQHGQAFGFQRAMDFAGAFLGTLICFFIIKYLFPAADKMTEPSAFYPIFIISLVPAFIGVVILFFVKDTTPKIDSNNSFKPKPNLKFREYERNLQFFFLAQFIFTLGNSSNQFLLLRSTNLGFSLSPVLLMYIIFNFTTAIFATSFGKLSDKIGYKKLLIAGYSLYAAVYIGFGFITPGTGYLLWIFWPIYGLYYAMTEGVEKAFVALSAPVGSKGTALGFYNTIVGIGLLPASIIAGFLFSLLPRAPFIFGGIMAIAALIILSFFVKEDSFRTTKL